MSRRESTIGERAGREAKRILLNLVFGVVAVAIVLLVLRYYVMPTFKGAIRKMGEDSKARVEKLKAAPKP